MAFGDPIDIEVTVSGESNVISSFQGGTTNVTQYSGGNSIISTLAGNTSTTTSITGYNVGVTMEGDLSTSVGDSSFTPFDCSDLDQCNLFESGDISGLGTIFVSGSGNYLLVSGVASSAAIEVKNEGVSLTSAVSSFDFVGDGITATNSGPIVTISSAGAITGARNIGSGSGIYSGLGSPVILLRSLMSSGNVYVTGAPNDDQHIYFNTLLSGSIQGGAGGGGGGSWSQGGETGSPPTGVVPATGVGVSVYSGVSPSVEVGCAEQYHSGDNYTTLLVQSDFDLDKTLLLIHSEVTTNSNAKLLIQSEAADGNTVIEDSTSNHSITRYDVAHSTTKSKFGNSSLHFDGNDYLQIADHDDFEFGTEDFTVEFWFNADTLGINNPVLISKWESGGTSSFICYYSYSAGKIDFLAKDGATTASLTSTTSPQVDTWYHIAVVRNGTDLSMYIDGVKESSATLSSSYDITDSSYPVMIGAQNTTPINYFDGYMEEIRITKGTAVYRKEFNPQSAPFPILDSTDFIDSSYEDHTLTRVGDTVHSTTQSKFSTTSIYFDGTGDYLSVPDSDSLDFAKTDFTIEAWIYPTSTTGRRTIYSTSGGSGSNPKFVFYIHEGVPTIDMHHLSGGGNVSLVSTGSASINTWSHVVFLRRGSIYTFYINGVAKGTGSDSHDLTFTSTPTLIGYGVESHFGYFEGYMEEVRVSREARYANNFAVPTEKFQIDLKTATSSNTFKPFEFKDSSPKRHDVNTFGNTRHFFGQGKFGSTSIYFDGNGDYLSVPDSDHLDFGAETDFTIEAWIYPTSTTGRRAIYATSGGSGSNPKFVLYIHGGVPTIDIHHLSGGGNVSLVSTGSVAINVWSHVVFLRKESTYTFFINGVARGTGSDSHDLTFTSIPTVIGFGGEAHFGYFEGYMEEVRVTKGLAWYSENFTVPPAPFTAGEAHTEQSNCIKGSYDPLFDKAVLIILSNEIQGSTTFEDKSSSKHSITSVGGTKHSNEFEGEALQRADWAPFGKSVVKFDGTDDYLEIPWHSDFDVGDKDYTIEAWIKTSDTVGEIVSAFNQNSPHNGWLLGVGYDNNDGYLVFRGYGDGNKDVAVSDIKVNDNAWHHVAFVKDDYRYAFYIDGKPQGFGTLTANIEPSKQNILIGAANNTIKNRFFNGYIDSLRISKEHSEWGARYIGPFTPPALFPTKSLPEPGTADAQFMMFKGLVGLGTVSLASDDQAVYISGSADGSTQTAANIGYGSGIYSGTISDEFKLRSISGVSGIAVTGYEDNTIVVSGQTGSFLTGASNIGTGSGVYSERLGNDLKFKTLIAGPNIALSGDGEHIMISGAAAGGGGGGSTQTAANIGYGSGIYSGTISDEFKLRSLSGAGSVTIAGYEDSTIIVSGSAGGGGVTWTTPPPTHKNYAGTEGQISFDNQYYYVCIDTNEWRRVAISEW